MQMYGTKLCNDTPNLQKKQTHSSFTLRRNYVVQPKLSFTKCPIMATVLVGAHNEHVPSDLILLI